MNKNLASDIKKLRDEGYTYFEISEELKCSKGTISYHLGKGQKEKSLLRQKNNRAGIYSVKNKLNKVLNKKLNDFNYKENKISNNYVLDKQDAYFRITKNPVCYLTGRKINLENSSEYQLDHILPVSKGGSNELSNLGLACKDANRAKNDLILEDFINLCKEILIHNGYNVSKEQ